MICTTGGSLISEETRENGFSRFAKSRKGDCSQISLLKDHLKRDIY